MEQRDVRGPEDRYSNDPPPRSQPITARNERQLTPKPRSSGMMAAFSEGLSAPLLSTLRGAVADMGGDAAVLELPSLGDSTLDDLVPPELLEPLDAPLEAFAEDPALYENPTPGHHRHTRLKRIGTPTTRLPGSYHDRLLRSLCVNGHSHNLRGPGA